MPLQHFHMRRKWFFCAENTLRTQKFSLFVKTLKLSENIDFSSNWGHKKLIIPTNWIRESIPNFRHQGFLVKIVINNLKLSSLTVQIARPTPLLCLEMIENFEKNLCGILNLRQCLKSVWSYGRLRYHQHWAVMFLHHVYHVHPHLFSRSTSSALMFTSTCRHVHPWLLYVTVVTYWSVRETTTRRAVNIFDVGLESFWIGSSNVNTRRSSPLPPNLMRC